MVNEFYLSFRSWSLQIDNCETRLNFFSYLRAPYAYPHNMEQLKNLTCLVSFVESNGGSDANYFSKGRATTKMIGPPAESAIEIRCMSDNINRILSMIKHYKVEESNDKSVIRKELKRGLGLDVKVDILTHDIECATQYKIVSWCFNDWRLGEDTDF